ncbi:MAG: ATP-binding cassette domain-containing protein [Oscillospiraceae bacterium]|nr:ATP-binding cassette domain-containing protein [Oscillospiraceae bacterium]
MPNQLEIRNLTKQYGDFRALSNVSFTLDEGVTGLLGANGAGKSTLMKLMTDHIKRTGGEILWNGTDILQMGAKWRGLIGYTPQLPGVYDDFSAKRFLYYMGALKGMKRRDIKEQTLEMLNAVNLGDQAHKKIGTFSGGMRQRVLLASSMLGRPQVLILDEPTAGLDPEERIRIRNDIAELARDRIVLLATHVVSDIACIAKRVLLLRKGKRIAFETPQALLEDAEGKIGEFSGSYEEIRALQAKYPNGEIAQHKDGFVLRIAENPLPEGCRPVTDALTLEDVCHLYLKGDREYGGAAKTAV